MEKRTWGEKLNAHGTSRTAAHCRETGEERVRLRPAIKGKRVLKKKI